MLCKQCGKWFLKNSIKKYCSLECAYSSQDRNKKLGKHFLKDKGKTYEEIYGEEKAKWMKQIRKNSKINLGKKHSNQTKKIWSEQRTGSKNYFFNKHFFGKLNGRWIDGRSFSPYCEKFNSKLKETIRQRDNYICQLCQKTQLEEGHKLAVHHIHYDKENCDPDLITLCRSCNSKVNTNRDYWEKYFMDILDKRNLLYKDDDNEPIL